MLSSFPRSGCSSQVPGPAVIDRRLSDSMASSVPRKRRHCHRQERLEGLRRQLSCVSQSVSVNLRTRSNASGENLGDPHAPCRCPRGSTWSIFKASRNSSSIFALAVTDTSTIRRDVGVAMRQRSTAIRARIMVSTRQLMTPRCPFNSTPCTTQRDRSGALLRVADTARRGLHAVPGRRWCDGRPWIRTSSTRNWLPSTGARSRRSTPQRSCRRSCTLMALASSLQSHAAHVFSTMTRPP